MNTNEQALRQAAYYKVDRFLRNNLDDTDYSEYSAALDALALPAVEAVTGPSDADFAKTLRVSGHGSLWPLTDSALAAAGRAVLARFGSPPVAAPADGFMQVPTPEMAAPSDADIDWENERKDMPDRLKGRGDFHIKHRRIKDAEMLFAAALEINSLRQQLAFLKAKA